MRRGRYSAEPQLPGSCREPTAISSDEEKKPSSVSNARSSVSGDYVNDRYSKEKVKYGGEPSSKAKSQSIGDHSSHSYINICRECGVDCKELP
jgi:hypothetical protein